MVEPAIVFGANKQAVVVKVLQAAVFWAFVGSIYCVRCSIGRVQVGFVHHVHVDSGAQCALRRRKGLYLNLGPAAAKIVLDFKY